MIMPRLNKAISVILVSDFLLLTSSSLLTPIFALFMIQDIVGGSAQAVGFAIAIYWGVKSVLQLPIARYLDRNHGEIDDYFFMLGGLLAGALVIAGFFFATHVWHVYLLQALFGVTDSFLVPPFFAIFTRHIDKGSEGFEWSLRSSLSFGGGSALGGALGGILASITDFRTVFLISSLLYVASATVFILVRPYLLLKTPRPVRRIMREHKRH